MKRLFFPLLLVVMMLQSCSQIINNNAPKREHIKLESDIMTPEVLWSMGRIGETDISPDGTRVVYTVTDYDIKSNSGQSRIYVSDVSGKNVNASLRAKMENTVRAGSATTG